MTTFLTIFIYADLLVLASAGGWLMWHGIPETPVACLDGKGVDGRAEGKPALIHPIFDLEVTR